MCRRPNVISIALIALISVSNLAAEEPVPDWFHFDAKRPYQIFDAWKQLSTRDATIYLSENWNVIAGRVLTAPAMNAINTFDDPDAVRPAQLTGLKIQGQQTTLSLPPKSVVMLEFQ